MQHYSGFGLLKHSLSHHENWQSVWRNPTPKKKYDVIIIGGGGHIQRPLTTWQSNMVLLMLLSLKKVI